MAYLFLSFGEHLDTESKRRSELYGASLNDQFANLQRRIPAEKRAPNFQKFIDECFPSGLKRFYYISCPNFLREQKESIEGKPSFINNVVVRPEMSLGLQRCLPDNQNIILIGDIFDNGKLKLLQVKGIEFIDAGMSSPNDKIISAEACLSFSDPKASRRIWSISSAQFEQSVFTPDFIKELIDECYTVDNPEEVRKTYEKWNKYIQFRNYYLEEQSKRNFELDSCEFVDSYAVNRKEYRMNSSVYDDYILDDIDDFKKGDMVVLSSKVAGAESFPLVKLTIDRNKKAFDQAKVLKGNKMANEEERKIRSLASDNVLITALDPKSPEVKTKDRYNFGLLLKNGYELGERFRIVVKDIEPTEHLAELEQNHDFDVSESFKDIDGRFAKKIENELSKHFEEYGAKLDEEIKESLKKKQEELDFALKDIIKRNTNKETSEDDIREYCLARNVKILQALEKELLTNKKAKLSEYKASKSSKLKNKYGEDIRKEKIAKKEELDDKLKADQQKIIEDETIHRFSLYFRLGDINNEIKDKQKEAIKKCRYIVYDYRAERAKINRQQAALQNFYSGYVKNPYLSTYLFNPGKLQPAQYDYSDWTWYLDSLNDKQKEAVRKAVASNGVFLLQGPPGTGKTQVIAETVAQMVNKGKKVLISSETHKAIDNVFERLPKIAEIVPVRLIPSNRKNENNYDPKYLVDNFYKNIRTNLLKAVDRYKNFNKTKDEFEETFGQLKVLKSKIDKNKAVLDKANQEIQSFEEEAKKINFKIDNLSEEKEGLKISLDNLRRTIRHIEKNNLRDDEDIKIDVILNIRKKFEETLSGEGFADIELQQLLKNICAIKSQEIDEEIPLLDPNTNELQLKLQIEELKHQLSKCRDDLGDPLPGKEDEIKNLKNKLSSALNKRNESKDGLANDNLKLCGIFRYSYLAENASLIKENIDDLKTRISEIKAECIGLLNDKIEKLEAKSKALEDETNALRNRIKEINNYIIDIQEREDIKELESNKKKFESQINVFFRDFEISEPYTSIDEALKIISQKWNELEKDFASKEKENKEKIPMYEEISEYLSSDEIIDEDRKTYTKDLFESANVFGITCTANDRFSGNSVEALSEYNIDDVDIKSVGIDVVIIDEVSKSSFIDLLIPILYGKTVILVGDHRQLPPMYEFAKLRDDDFDGLDENIINKSINKKFTALYEECFFKTMFEKIPDSYKTMLLQQYRCHEHIMNVFNSFYQGQLKLGFAGQNNTKNHDIRIISNGRTIIEPDKHIYFVNCRGKETHEQDSTSMYNTGEAEVVAELLKKMNNYFKQHQNLEKLSVGVICTYGDQARKIKEINKREKVKTDAFKTDTEKMIISTVDDFQGDERDIIILSMVRNPENPARSNPGFITAYQRINVALSRARRLLIVVGNRDYLEDKGVIDLPDIYGKGKDRHNFRVYKEIIDTIERYGRVVDDVDVLEEKEARING